MNNVNPIIAAALAPYAPQDKQPVRPCLDEAMVGWAELFEDLANKFTDLGDDRFAKACGKAMKDVLSRIDPFWLEEYERDRAAGRVTYDREVAKGL